MNNMDSIKIRIKLFKLMNLVNDYLYLMNLEIILIILPLIIIILTIIKQYIKEIQFNLIYSSMKTLLTINLRIKTRCLLKDILLTISIKKVLVIFKYCRLTTKKIIKLNLRVKVKVSSKI
jgi:hypothetical protein